MALGKKNGAVVKYGGGSLQIKEVSSTGGVPSYPAWGATTVYKAGDRFTNGGSAYRVNTGYTSGATFGATDTTNCSVVSAYRDISYLQESTLTDQENNAEPLKDESGNVVAVADGEIEVRFEALLMQTDKDVLDYLRELRGKYLAIKYAMGKILDGTVKTQTLYLGLCDVPRSIEVKSGTKRVPFKAVALPAPADLTVDTSVTQLSGDYYIITEA